jgi:IS30 family transposase
VRPPARRRCGRCLSLAEREEVSRGLARGDTFRAIAAQLGRSHTTVSREVARNGGRARYRAQRADAAAWDRARRPKPSKLALNARLRAVVESKLELRWSPQQISRWLRRTYPGDLGMAVSHETIYLSLFVQSRGALRRELSAHLRSGRRVRRPRGARPKRQGQGQIPGRVMISERPADVADRAVPGHWEGDLLLGKLPTAIATLVERSTRYCQLVALPDGQSAEAVRDALARSIGSLPEQLRRSLTWDQGKEMIEHLQFTIDSGVQVYFCDPRSPWQRGSNENTNGLLRQYFPRRSDLGAVSQAELDHVAAELNGRPRQTLGWMSPAERLAEVLADTSPQG